MQTIKGYPTSQSGKVIRRGIPGRLSIPVPPRPANDNRPRPNTGLRVPGAVSATSIARPNVGAAVLGGLRAGALRVAPGLLGAAAAQAALQGAARWGARELAKRAAEEARKQMMQPDYVAAGWQHNTNYWEQVLQCSAPPSFPHIGTGPVCSAVFLIPKQIDWTEKRSSYSMYDNLRPYTPGSDVADHSQLWYEKAHITANPTLRQPFNEVMPRPYIMPANVPKPIYMPDPWALPITAPAPEVMPLPFRVLPFRRPNPWRNPNERSVSGYRANPLPRSRNIPGGTGGKWTVDPDGKPRWEPRSPRRPPPIRKPPPKGEKDKKLRGVDRNSKLGKLLNGGTESLDVLGSIWGGLPYNKRTRHHKNWDADHVPDWMQKKFGWNGVLPGEMITDIVNNFDHINWGRVAIGLVGNHYQDKNIGRLGRYQGKASKRLGISFGIGHGPAM